MKNKNYDFSIYFFKRENKKNIPGYDQISIVAISQKQAETILNEILINVSDWYYDHVAFLSFDDAD